MKGVFLSIFYLSTCLFTVVWARDDSSSHSLQNRKRPPLPCVEEKHVLYAEMFPLNFELERSTVGEDQIGPVKNKVTALLASHEAEFITDIEITASSSQAPFFTTAGNGKRVLDPESGEKNLSLAKERASFAEKVLKGLKESHPKINVIVQAELSGPDFRPTDLNDRFVTRMTPSYGEKLESLYQKYKTAFNDQALIQSSYDLIDEKKYGNLFLAKFKPFHGIRMVVRGHKRELMKCLDKKEINKAKSRSTKQ